MQQFDDNESLAKRFMTPVEQLLVDCKHTRQCNGLSDWQWIQMGVERSLRDERSGRSFLQNWAMEHSEASVHVGHFFGTLQSKRRLGLVEELNTKLVRSMPSHSDSLLDGLEDLGEVDVYAGDGHYHGASVHDRPIKGKRRGICHFYTLNLRTHGLSYLAAADLQGGRKKKEHDMHALKRMSTQQLRQGAAKGRQVLYVWDCAGIDIRQWYRWKQSGGVYFLSQVKDLLKITCYGELDFDREDTVNAGVLTDQYASTETGETMIRYIRYKCPRTQNEYEFITNHMKIRPGVLAWLYMRRWDIEKTYDTFKNKLEEKKAWASSDVAKTMQAQFLCLAHNLMVSMEDLINTTLEVDNHKETQRCQKRHRQDRQACMKNGTHRSELYYNSSKRSQLTLKFIRWLRHHLRKGSLFCEAISSLKLVYAMF